MLVVCYHDVVTAADPLDRCCSRVPADEFRQQMELIARTWPVVDPAELPAALDRDAPGPPGVLVTFDDGYRGVREHALPVLRSLGIHACVFAITGLLDDEGGRRPDEVELALRLTRQRRLSVELPSLRPGPGAQRVARSFPLESPEEKGAALLALRRHLKLLPADEQAPARAAVCQALGVTPAEVEEAAAAGPAGALLGWKELRELQEAGWCVGGHTRRHRTLSRLAPADLTDEIHGCAADLAAHLDPGPRPFAYPHGEPEHIGPDAPRVAQDAGFTCAFTTLPGRNESWMDRFWLRRVTFPVLRHLAGPRH